MLNPLKWQRKLARVPWSLVLPGGCLAGCLLLYSWAIWQNSQETLEARQVAVVQQQLQRVIQQAQAGHVPITQRENIVNALKASLPHGLTLDKEFRLAFAPSGREVQFGIEPDGRVRVIKWVNFSLVKASTPLFPTITPNPKIASE